MVKTKSGAGVAYTPADQQGRAGRQHFVTNPREKKRRSARVQGEAPSDDRKPSAVDHPEEKSEPSVSERKPTRHLRSAPARCLSYGPLRKELWPEYQMCMHCDAWESQSAHCTGNARADSQAFRCQSGHTSCIRPTALKKVWCPSHQGTTRRVLPPKAASTPKPSGDDHDIPELVARANKDSSDEEDEDMPPPLGDGDSDYSSGDDAFRLENPTNLVIEGVGWETDDEVDGYSESSEVSEDDSDSCMDSDFWVDSDEELWEMELAIAESESALSEAAEERRRADEYRHALLDCQREKEQLKKDVEVLRRRLQDVLNKRRNDRRTEKRRQAPRQEDYADLELYLEACLEFAMRHHTQGRKSKVFAAALTKVVWELKGGFVQEAVLKKGREWYRENVFSDWNFARLLDIKGAVLNLSAIDAIRSLENPEYRSRDTMMPTSSAVKRVMETVERIGDVIVPYEMTNQTDGEAFQFDYEKTLRVLLNAFGLHDAATQRSVDWSLAMDGAKLTTRLNHTTAGIKIRDHAAIDPLTDTPVFAGENSFAQSRDLCFPLHMHMGSETKERYQTEFEEFFEFFKKVRLEGFGEYEKMNVAVNADMSAVWKGLDRGGAANQAKNPCHCCNVTSDELATNNAVGCSRWCNHVQPGELQYDCYHRPMVTDEVLQSMQAEQSQLQEALSHHLHHLKDSKIKDEDPNTTQVTAQMRRHRFSIFYEPRNNAELGHFELLLETELQMRGVVGSDLPNNMESRRTKLRTFLVKEYRLTHLSKEVELSSRPRTALFLLLQAVPCILHLENRVGLKTIEILLIYGLSLCKTANVLNRLHRQLTGENQRIKAFFKDVERVINRSILGSIDEPAQWMVPYDSRTKKILAISFENWKTRRIMEQLEELIEVSVLDIGKKTRWLRFLPPYGRFMKKLRQKDNWNTEEEMATFQKDIDKWIHDWIGLGHNVTNYMHMLAAGHITEYVGHYGNLYEHSQQGWEGLNALLKSVFFRRTSRGGGRKKSRLKPIARWLQRRMMWLIGLTKEKAQEYLASPLFKESQQQMADGEDVEEDLYEGLFWEMVI